MKVCNTIKFKFRVTIVKSEIIRAQKKKKKTGQKSDKIQKRSCLVLKTVSIKTNANEYVNM